MEPHTKTCLWGLAVCYLPMYIDQAGAPLAVTLAAGVFIKILLPICICANPNTDTSLVHISPCNAQVYGV